MYAKVFRNLFYGSMSGKLHAQHVFIFLLTHCDPDGYVEMPPSVIGPLCGMDSGEVDAALAVLSSPDPDSRTDTNEGRRLEAVGHWRWQVVNFAKYRTMRDENARREQTRQAVARHRARNGKPSKPSVSRGKPTVSRRKPVKAHTDADAEAYAEAQTEAETEAEAQPSVVEPLTGSRSEKDFDSTPVTSSETTGNGHVNTVRTRTGKGPEFWNRADVQDAMRRIAGDGEITDDVRNLVQQHFENADLRHD